MKKRGFSLIELLIVIAIISVVGTIATRSMSRTFFMGGKSTAINKIRENGDFAITEIERTIRSADRIVPGDPCFSGSNSINLETLGNPGIPTNFLGVSDGAITKSGTAITSDGVVLAGNINFECTPASTLNPASVRVSFTLRSQNNNRVATRFEETFQTTVQLRNY